MWNGNFNFLIKRQSEELTNVAVFKVIFYTTNKTVKAGLYDNEG
jgi:hypothetical protein